MLKALKWTTILLLLIGVVIGTYVLVQWQHWPVWANAVILAGFGALIILILLARHALNRSREKTFIHNIVREDEKRIAALGNRDEGLSELRAQWLRAITVLRSLPVTRS